MKKILVATTNQGKLAELSAMLDMDIQWLSLADFPGIDQVEEDGLTFAENARKKAIGYAKATSQWTVADDSGLVIDALDGAPGIHSARFSGPKQDDTDRTLIDRRNIARVLELMRDVPDSQRTARFVCSLCMASAEEVLIETQGVFEGLIAEREAGSGGFGYDPIFFVPKLGKTVAQLSGEQKNAISHRGRAIGELKPLLGEILQRDYKS